MKKTTKHYIAALFIVAAFVAVGLGAYFGSRFRQSAAVAGTVAPLRSSPDFQLRDYQGNEIKRSNLAGKALIINSWASWCPFCVEELPNFAALKKEFGDRIVVVEINRGETLEAAQLASAALAAEGGLVFLLDPADSWYHSIGGFSMPETVFVDENGLIRAHRRGPMNTEELRRRTEELLNSR